MGVAGAQSISAAPPVDPWLLRTGDGVKVSRRAVDPSTMFRDSGVRPLLVFAVGTALALPWLAAAPAAAAPAAATASGTVSLQAAPTQNAGLAASTRRGRTGNLRIVVKGVPNGAAANVVVKGRGFREKVTRTTTLRQLRPGRYRVAIKPIGGVGKTSRERARVQAGKKTVMTVTYSISAGQLPEVADEPVADAVRTQPSALERQVFELTNEMRAEPRQCGSYGLQPAVGPLKLDEVLTTAARGHSQSMADNNFFDHVYQGLEAGDRILAAGYIWSAWGENIAAGQTTAKQVVQEWMDSPGHCVNIMAANYTEIGVGYAEGPGQYGVYWTQNFARP